jgi:hypothetical protein
MALEVTVDTDSVEVFELGFEEDGRVQVLAELEECVEQRRRGLGA